MFLKMSTKKWLYTYLIVMSIKLSRVNSICADPKTELLNRVAENDIVGLKGFLEVNPHLINENYSNQYYGKPILHIACYDLADQVLPEAIDVLLQYGADCFYYNEAFNGKNALHFAAWGQNPEILKTIINKIGKNKIDEITSIGNNTALHVLIKDGRSTQKKYFVKCAEILVENGIDINKTDSKNIPPIYLAAKHKLDHIVHLLLRCTNIKLDNYKDRSNKTARDLIRELKISADHIPATTDDGDISEQLMSLLKDNRPSDFIQLFNTNVVIENNNSDMTFLQRATTKNYPEVVELLLKRGFSSTDTGKNQKIPMKLAAENGHHEILKILLKHQETYPEILTDIMSKLNYEHNDENGNYHKSLKVLMESGNYFNVNHCDHKGNYPLHYAIRYGNSELVLELLKLKASLANRNVYGFLDISDIDHDTLKEHFDMCVIARPPNQTTKEDMIVNFDYSTILPVVTNFNNDRENGYFKPLKKTQPYPETDVVLFMSKSPELKKLLSHPLITSFLFMKWHKMKWVFYLNFLFYIIFCLSLLLFSYFFYNDKEKSSSSYFFYTLLFFTTLILFFRETFQIFLAPSKYFSNFENYIEVALICLVAYMLFAVSPTKEVKTPICAFVFLLTAFELLFLLGNYPGLSTNIVMLRTVSWNFFKFLLFYAILILAFAFSFYTLFQDKKSQPNNSTDMTTGTENEDNGEEFFDNPLISIFKTIIMLTGEFEAGEIQFSHYPIWSHLVFLAFVVTIAIILLNLLNGLAVSDTQEIKSEAELIGYIARAEYVSYAESLILSSVSNPKSKRGCKYAFASNNVQKYVRKILCVPLADRICLYKDYLNDDKQLTVYPNQNGRVQANGVKAQECMCNELCLDKATMKRTTTLLQEQKENDKMRKELNKTNETMKEILEKLDIILNRT